MEIQRILLNSSTESVTSDQSLTERVEHHGDLVAHILQIFLVCSRLIIGRVILVIMLTVGGILVVPALHELAHPATKVGWWGKRL